MELIYFKFYRSQTLELQACFIYYLIYWLVFANLFFPDIWYELYLVYSNHVGKKNLANEAQNCTSSIGSKTELTPTDSGGEIPKFQSRGEYIYIRAQTDI